MDHTLQVRAFSPRPPLHALVDQDIVKEEIEEAITEDSDANRKHVDVMFHLAEVVNECHGRHAEDQRKEVVPFQPVIVNGVMRLVP
jgi:hypothetical protein